MKPERLMGRQPQGCWWSLPGHSLLWDASGRRTLSRNPASKKANPLISSLQVVMALTKVWDLLISYCILMWTFLDGSQMLCDGGHQRPRKGGFRISFMERNTQLRFKWHQTRLTHRAAGQDSHLWRTWCQRLASCQAGFLRTSYAADTAKINLWNYSV